MHSPDIPYCPMLSSSKAVLSHPQILFSSLVYSALHESWDQFLLEDTMQYPGNLAPNVLGSLYSCYQHQHPDFDKMQEFGFLTVMSFTCDDILGQTHIMITLSCAVIQQEEFFKTPKRYLSIKDIATFCYFFFLSSQIPYIYIYVLSNRKPLLKHSSPYTFFHIIFLFLNNIPPNFHRTCQTYNRAACRRVRTTKRCCNKGAIKS